MTLPINDIAALLNLPKPANPAEISVLLTDSRSLANPENTLFFAIPTESNDGHNFIRELYDKGVRNFVVNRIPEEMRHVRDANFLITGNTTEALQKIARRRLFNMTVAAITGSRGKTTLKEWIYQLMEPFTDMMRSPRSYNSQIGVPLSLWMLTENTEIALIEAGISRPNEMDKLRECIIPDIVIFTNIGPAHQEGFSSMAEKAREKALLISENTKHAIVCLDYPELAAAVKERCRETGTVVSGWSMKDASAPLFIHRPEKCGSRQLIRYVYEGEEHQLLFPGDPDEHDIENIANALLFMLLNGADAETISERFASLHRIGTRLSVKEGVNGCHVVFDSYTSDFSSLQPAIDFVRRRAMPGQSITLILSDLHHENPGGASPCPAIAELMRNMGVKRFIGVGETLKRNSALFPQGSLFFKNAEDLLHHLSTSDFSNEIVLLKGSPEHDLSEVSEMLEARKHETVLEVNLDAVVRNYNYFRSHLKPGTGMVCMVKASGYGAGSYEIAKTLQDAGASYLAVAVLDEGIDLRRNGITMPIMVMNPKVVNYRSMFANRLEPEIYSFAMLKDVIREAGKNNITGYPIHIKLDTGMHRMGFIESELPELMEIIGKSSEVSIRSVFSHLATADCPDMDEYTELQLKRFDDYTRYMLSRSSRPFLRHILNSAGILRYPEYDYDMVRLGIGLYGANTLPESIEKPLDVVSSLRTVIIAIREWQPGETIGYGRKGVISRPSRIATIPIGYADGMNRHFGNGNISVMINGREAPTIGNICMDACMIDVTGIECNVGDSVEIFGKEAPLYRLSDLLGTIPYEILTSVSPRVKRIYYRE